MIYCTGDSFTAGEELSDHLFFENHPGYLGHEPLRNQGWYLSRNLNTTDKALLLSENKKRAWPQKLANLIGSDIVNTGTTGASTYEKVNLTINDCLLDKSIDTVIFQLITDARVCRAVNGEMTSMQLGYEYPNNLPVQHYVKTIAAHETDFTLRMQWVFDLIRLKDFCKNNNIQLIFINANTDFYHSFPDIGHVTKYLDLSNIISMRNISRTLWANGTHIKCPGGHFTEVVHEETARKIKDYLDETKR